MYFYGNSLSIANSNNYALVVCLVLHTNPISIEHWFFRLEFINQLVCITISSRHLNYSSVAIYSWRDLRAIKFVGRNGKFFTKNSMGTSNSNILGDLLESDSPT